MCDLVGVCYCVYCKRVEGLVVVVGVMCFWFFLGKDCDVSLGEP